MQVVFLALQTVGLILCKIGAMVPNSLQLESMAEI
jgi:hypothetical protein